MPADAAHPSQSPAQRASETQTLVAVSSAHLISHFYSMVLPVLLPLLKDRLDVSFLDLAFALTAFSVVTGLTQAPVGFLVDKVGARPILIAGLLLGGFAFVSLAPATSYAWLLLVALLGGLANSVYHPADYAMLANGISEERIGRAFAVHTFAGFLGGAIAPLGPVDALGLRGAQDRARLRRAARPGGGGSIACAEPADVSDPRPDHRTCRGARKGEPRQCRYTDGAGIDGVLHPARSVE